MHLIAYGTWEAFGVQMCTTVDVAGGHLVDVGETPSRGAPYDATSRDRSGWRPYAGHVRTGQQGRPAVDRTDHARPEDGDAQPVGHARQTNPAHR